jgi:hypothetical protein
MRDDPIVAEVRAVREAFAARYNYDIDAMYAAMKAREGKDGLERTRLSPKRIAPQAEK